MAKEPEFFGFNNCFYNLTKCSNGPAKAGRTVRYINETMRLPEFVAAGGKKGVFESSTHYVRNGDRLVAPLLPYMPWLKIIVSLREPISRAISMLVHLQDKGEGCLMKRDLGTCLLEDSQINGDGAGARATNYSFTMSHWVEGWPSDKMHVIQVRESRIRVLPASKFVCMHLFLGVCAFSGSSATPCRSPRYEVHH